MYPWHWVTGRRGYFANAGSISDKPHLQYEVPPRGCGTTRAWRQIAHSPTEWGEYDGGSSRVGIVEVESALHDRADAYMLNWTGVELRSEPRRIGKFHVNDWSQNRIEVRLPAGVMPEAPVYRV
ncbi:MAG: hypothetical protein AMXMBFR4_20050 [Candidatus Hydrogenedentota bacterium]